MLIPAVVGEGRVNNNTAPTSGHSGRDVAGVAEFGAWLALLSSEPLPPSIAFTTWQYQVSGHKCAALLRACLGFVEGDAGAGAGKHPQQQTACINKRDNGLATRLCALIRVLS